MTGDQVLELVDRGDRPYNEVAKIAKAHAKAMREWVKAVTDGT